MHYKVLIIILSIVLLSSWSLFIFWQRADIFSFWEEKFSKTEAGEFDQIYVVEIPPKSKYFAGGTSEKIFGALQFEADIITQNNENILLGLLQLFDIQYVLLHDKKYWEIFEPFLEYSSEEERQDLPRTFPVRKEALSSSSEPFLILGEGWYELENDDYGYARRWFGKEAIIHYIIPPGTLSEAPNLLSLFLGPWSPLLDKKKRTEIEVMVNRKKIYSSGYYEWGGVLQLVGLQEGINEIKLRSSQGCIVLEGDDRCLGFMAQKLELFRIKDIPLERPLRLDHFIKIGEGQYWVGTNFAIHIFNFSPNPSSATFQIQAVDGKARMISVIEKNKEINRIILFGEEPQKIESLTYQKGINTFYFIADGCEDKIVEGEKRCIAAQIKDLEIELVK